ncbi:hypothetical protein BRC74_01060 [Halobacteriales archaeon QH_7_68_42]|nr:MAG: hypothetical protein BRC74_01060 [Halobacteriales archaeon QH_7_68_42]
MALPTPDVDPVLADLAERGYETTCLDGVTTPPAVAAGGDPPGAVTDRPLSVEPLAEATPLSLVAALADAARHERGALFVADPEAAAAAVEVLSDPFLLADERADGRVFYSIPDRIHLTDGTLAAVTARDPTWREDAPGGVTGDERALLLEADGETLAALESVEALTCPGPDPEAVPFRYARGEDKRFRVYDRDREVGTFTGVTAMESRGFRPLDMPLVPEHHLRENAGLARRWTVAVVDDGVEYVTP